MAGPNVIQSEDHVFKMCRHLKDITDNVGVKFIFKASFDKANRTSCGSFRGPGMEEGLKVLGAVKTAFDVPIVTDIHEASQAEPVSRVADVLQIPAFLCRQTDLLLAAGKTGNVINIKKGQCLAPWDVEHIVKKIKETGHSDILLTDRGTQFGYNNLVADMRAIPLMKKYGYPVVFDATHSAQLPGASGGYSSGMRDMIPTLARSAVAAGCSGVFMEVHDKVDSAKSDAATQWPLSQLKDLLINLINIHNVVN